VIPNRGPTPRLSEHDRPHLILRDGEAYPSGFFGGARSRGAHEQTGKPLRPEQRGCAGPLKTSAICPKVFNHLVTLPSYRFAWEIVVSNISVSDVMALRSAVLDRNSALRNVVNSSAASPASAGGIARPTFDAAMSQALQKVEGPGSVGSATGANSSFASTIVEQVLKVNETGAKAGALTVAYERGETTDIAKVMLARQAASIGFEATLQVRNKVLSAYKDIMSMAI
jgi:flagellar hook-basal body complex protein FliE